MANAAEEMARRLGGNANATKMFNAITSKAETIAKKKSYGDYDDLMENIDNNNNNNNNNNNYDELLSQAVVPTSNIIQNYPPNPNAKKKNEETLKNILPPEILERVSTPPPNKYMIENESKKKLLEKTNRKLLYENNDTDNSLIRELEERVNELEKKNIKQCSNKNTDGITLNIEGVNYKGKIKQNKKGQILFFIKNTNKCIILKPIGVGTVK